MMIFQYAIRTYVQKLLIQFGISIFLLGFFLTISPVSIVFAADIPVSTSANELDGSSGNGACSLQEAIANANNDNSDQVDCPAGSGDDLINIPSGIYMVSSDIIIIDNLTINGAGASATIIDRNASSTDTTERVFYITSGLTVNMKNITVQNGHAGELNNDNGGGIYNNNATLNINNCIIANNSCGTSTIDSGFGAGIYNNGILNINTSIISNNTAKIRGGGIANENGGVAVVNNSTFSGNEAQFGGGVVYDSALPQSSINNSTFTNNMASNRGGGIHVQAGELTITNSTFSGNTGNIGAGISNRGQLNVYNSTIVNNHTATTSSGSIDQNAGTLNIYNSIVAIEQNANALNCVGQINDGGYNLEDSDDCNFTSPTSQVNTDPNLGPLSYNGGPTLTHALQSNSLNVIDQIPSANCALSPINSIDQRGAARNFNGDDISSSNECDIGAYELHEIMYHCNIEVNTTYDFIFDNSGNSVRVEVPSVPGSAGDINCIAIEEAGAVHLESTSTDFENNFWHISAVNLDDMPASGYTLNLTLPHSNLTDPRICRYPGNSGGYGWDCYQPTNANNSMANLDGITELSDWAMVNDVGPTAIHISLFEGKSSYTMSDLILGLIILGGLYLLHLFKKREIHN